MQNALVSYNLYTLPMHDATLDEQDSYNLLQNYFSVNYLNHTYKYPSENISLTDFQLMVSNFCLFHGKVKDAQTDRSFHSNAPLYVIRYIMLADGSWSPYYTVRRKPGYVVEGLAWSNGLVYQVRDDLKEDFQIHQIVLSIDNLTKTLRDYPDIV